MRKLYIFWFLHQTTTPMGSVPVLCRCISFDSYIKPQQNNNVSIVITVVYLLIPTSNHNAKEHKTREEKVVYLLIPTSNHNIRPYLLALAQLYIFWFLHQTTTSFCNSRGKSCCISFDSYIKPQLSLPLIIGSAVVYLLIPTSNHNI